MDGCLLMVIREVYSSSSPFSLRFLLVLMLRLVVLAFSLLPLLSFLSSVAGDLDIKWLLLLFPG